MLALKRLDACQFVGAHRRLPLLSESWRVVIDGTNCSDRGIFVRINGRGEPITDQMGLQIPLFKSRDACRGEMDVMMPRSMTSSAISRPVQCVMGRSLGCSQAKAISWQNCSEVI
jgi:hypothetical protein